MSHELTLGQRQYSSSKSSIGRAVCAFLVRLVQRLHRLTGLRNIVTSDEMLTPSLLAPAASHGSAVWCHVNRGETSQRVRIAQSNVQPAPETYPFVNQ